MHTAAILVGLLGLSLIGMTAQGEARPSHSRQVGQASWYGPFHHGRPTANGERFSMYRMTAAHRTLPLGTIVAVTNLQTGRRVTVRINDRGPYVDPKHRIIDLSRAVARRLGLEHSGLGHVRVTVVQRAPARPRSVAARRHGHLEHHSHAWRVATRVADPHRASDFSRLCRPRVTLRLCILGLFGVRSLL
jgi:rare lipoprotein A